MSLFGRLDELLILYAVDKRDYKSPIYFDVSELVKYVEGADSPSLEPSDRPRQEGKELQRTLIVGKEDRFIRGRILELRDVGEGEREPR